MKLPKLQFRLSTIIVAVAILGIALSLYRHHLYVEQRLSFHRQELKAVDFSLLNKNKVLSVFLDSREALLAGDEDRLERLTSRIVAGQPEQIVNAPHQLVAVDNALLDLKDEIAQQEVVQKYHADVIAGFEQSRWRPWHRVGELASPPTSLHVQKYLPPPQPGGEKQKPAPAPLDNP